MWLTMLANFNTGKTFDKRKRGKGVTINNEFLRMKRASSNTRCPYFLLYKFNTRLFSSLS